MHPFLSHADELWCEWLKASPPFGPEIASLFDLDACPEPYLDFDAGANPLVVVTTNPGASLPHQNRRAILRGCSPIRPGMRYDEVARVMAKFYIGNLTGPAARRIEAQRTLGELAGFDGVLQVETCPWHSAALPSKSRYLRLMSSERRLLQYVQHLQGFVTTRPVVAISAVSSRARLDGPFPKLAPWPSWLASLLGIRTGAADLVPLVWNEARVTAAALIRSNGGAPKALVLMMGNNNLPGAGGRARLLKLLRSSG